VDEVYNLIRGTNPQPGAWTLFNGNELKIFDCRKVEGAGEPGTVLSVDDDSFTVAAQGGALRVERVRPHDDKKISAGDFIAKSGLAEGARLGS
jgi:methionyl-tRNA formyltransferase